MQKKITLYDTTLREGAQGEGAAFTVKDKLKIVGLLDEAGVPYIECGNPGSNPKDRDFYAAAAKLKLRQARLVAFGATCRLGSSPEQDGNLKALLAANTPAVAVFGKCWDFHVTDILRATLEENLKIISNTVAYLKANGREVIFDAEHFFDGYKHSPDYALAALRAAAQAGADWVCLCDTNGGSFPHEIGPAVRAACGAVDCPVGIHCHDDTGMAQADTVEAVRAGATMAQGTLCGLGERCGNTDLWVMAANLQVKLGYPCLPESSITRLAALAQLSAETMNITLYSGSPYVGRNAFAHKAGMHIDAVKKDPRSFEHVPPEAVGAKRQFLLSEISGRMAVLQRARQILPELTKDSPETQNILSELKALENRGYQFEGADASFELLVRRMTGLGHTYFDLKGFKVIINEPALDGHVASAMVEIAVNGEEEISAAVGNGPVNALDRAARRALERFYPSLKTMHLSDFKVRVLDSSDTTAALVRVIIESSDETGSWTTIGVSSDVIEASWQALVDSLEYKLLRDQAQPQTGE